MASGGNGEDAPEADDAMELDSAIIRDFQNMRVLNGALNYDQMGDLVRDLSNALEESVKHKKKEESKHTRQATVRKGKRKSKKRKSTLYRLTDSKESSLDEAVKDYIYIESMTHQSDSDDWIHNGKRLPALASLSKQVIPQVESDSFTENFSPMQPLRRRRKFKRMAVDLSSDTNTDSLLTKNPTVKLKTKVHLTSSDNIMDEDRSRSPVSTPGTSDTLSGKRKRGIRCPGNSFEVDGNSDECFTKCMEREDRMDQEHKDSTSSSLSSSECSEVRFTGDEGQEGDDEQSDFFFEPGPACGIPGIIPWWENEQGAAGGSDKDPRFEHILNGSIQHMSQAARNSFKHRLKQLTKPGREYRSARRYFKDRRPAYSLSRFLQDRQKWGDCNSKKLSCASWQCNGSNGSSGVDTKRRRKTPPDSPEGEYVGQHADPIPESNIGNQILQNMGWTPGTGLGAEGLGITTPIVAYRKNSRKGLGATASTPS